MATRFVDLNEASTILGVTPERLVEMRSNNEIHGYRDGASWKFKIEEVERVKADMTGGGDEGPIPFDSGLEEGEMQLASDDDTVDKGRPAAPAGPVGGTPDSDLKLSEDDDLRLSPEESDLALGADSAMSLEGSDEAISLDSGPAKSGSAVDSDVALVPGTKSDVELVPDTGSDRKIKATPEMGADVLGDSDLALNLDSGTGDLPPGAGTSRSLGSSDLDIALDSELALSDDDDMVLGGSGTGSDLSLHAGDSGINLGSPTDSGLSLEADSGINLQTPTDSGLSLEGEPGEGPASSISALELPEDESIELDADAFEAGQGLKKDEEFLLSPSDEMFADESDSGSQVIALEESVAFDQEALGEPGALVAETGAMEQQLDALGAGVAAPMTAPTLGVGPVGVPESPYSIWNILGLCAILFFFTLSGVLLSDIMRNMWAWEDGLDVSTSISEGISGAFGLK